MLRSLRILGGVIGASSAAAATLTLNKHARAEEDSNEDLTDKWDKNVTANASDDEAGGVIGASSAAAATLTLNKRALAEEGGERLPVYRDDNIKFAGEDVTDKWIKEVIANASDDEAVERAQALKDRRDMIRRTCPPIPHRSSWPKVTDEEVGEWIVKHEEFGLPRQELFERGRDIVVQQAVKMAETETPLGLQPQDRENVMRSAREDGVVEDLLSPVDRHKHGWHPCWEHLWELKRTFRAISEVYPGTPKQFEDIMSVSERNLIEHERFAECMSTADAAENDELYTQATEREQLLAAIAEASK